MHVLRKTWRGLALIGMSVALVSGCEENLAGGAACPTLCPDTLAVHDTVFTGHDAFDTITTVQGMPPLGTETQLLLANYVQGGGQVETAAIFRFDSLVRIYPDTDTTTPPRPITRVDSASLNISLIAPTDSTKDTVFVRDSVTFLVYDVDAVSADPDTAAVRARLSEPPIASAKFARDSVKGTLAIPLDSGWVADHVRNGKRIRLGVRVESPQYVQVRVSSAEGNLSATLNYFAYAGTDTAKAFISRSVNTVSHASPPISSLADYDLVLHGSDPPTPDLLAAGGIPGTRVYMRFNVPAALIDSTATIIRANLILHQKGDVTFGTADTTDTLLLMPMAVTATPAVQDIGAASILIADPTAIGASGVSTRNLHPDVSHPDTIPIVGLFIVWKQIGPLRSQRAIVLQSSGEGTEPRRYYFYGLDAPADSLKPRLEISYIPKSGFGLP